MTQADAIGSKEQIDIPQERDVRRDYAALINRGSHLVMPRRTGLQMRSPKTAEERRKAPGVLLTLLSLFCP